MTTTSDRRRQHYALASDVSVVRRSAQLLLVRESPFCAFRVGLDAGPLLPLLRGGADFETLEAALRIVGRDEDVERPLQQFLDELERAQLLSGVRVGRGGRRPRRWDLVDIDPAAERAAGVLDAVNPALLRATGRLAALGSAAGLLSHLARRRAAPELRRGSWVGAAAVFVSTVVPLHELAHAVACRRAGVQVGASGIVLHRGIIPGPYVDTTRMYTIADRSARVRVPLAGPYVDLLFGGATAWVCLVTRRGPSTDVLTALSGLCGVFLLFDLNPFVPSDGSRALESMLDDELARRSALRRRSSSTSTPLSIRRYRLACVGYCAAVTALVTVTRRRPRP